MGLQWGEAYTGAAFGDVVQAVARRPVRYVPQAIFRQVPGDDELGLWRLRIS